MQKADCMANHLLANSTIIWDAQSNEALGKCSSRRIQYDLEIPDPVRMLPLHQEEVDSYKQDSVY